MEFYDRNAPSITNHYRGVGNGAIYLKSMYLVALTRLRPSLSHQLATRWFLYCKERRTRSGVAKALTFKKS